MSRAFPFGLAFLFGMILVVAFPPLAGQDEVYHWQRVVQISEGHLLADTLGPNAYGGPIDANAYAYDLWFLKKFQDHQAIDIGEAWSMAHELAETPSIPSVTDFSNAANFSPLAYLPQSAGVFLARSVGANLLVQIFAGRAANLLCYLAFGALVFRVLPAGRLLFLAWLTLPTMFQVATTLSADPLNFVLPTLFVAWCWRCRVAGRVGHIWLAVGLLLFFVVLALLKPVVLMLGIFALTIPAERFGGTRRKLIAFGIAAFVGIAVGAAWNAAYPFVPGRFWQTGADPQRMIALILHDPGGSIRIAYGTVRDWAVIWWFDSYGRFGGHAPPFSLYTSPVLAELAFALVLALAICEGASRRDFRFAGTAWLVGLAYAALVLLAFWIGFTRPGSPTIDGIQGRYLFPTYFLIGAGIVAVSPLGDRLRRLGPPLFYGLLALDAVTLSIAVAHFHRYWHF